MNYHRSKHNASKQSDETEIDYKDVTLLRHYVTETYKIMSRRMTGMSAKKQRILRRHIKYARFLALVPFTDRHAQDHYRT